MRYKREFPYHQEDARVDGECRMTGGEGLAGVVDKPAGELYIHARVRSDVSAMQIRKRHCFCRPGLGADYKGKI